MVEPTLSRLDVWVWAYFSPDTRNYPGLHFTAKPASCDALLGYLQSILDTPQVVSRTVPLREPRQSDIALISGDTRHPDARDRLRGYRAALEAAGVPFDPALVMPGNYTEDSGCMAVERLLDSRQFFSAIFAANDQMAFGAALALHRRNLHVPGDVSLVGFDDLAGAVYSIPPLSTVHQPVYEVGQSAASAMLQLLAGQVPDASLPAPRFIVRESTRALQA